MITIKNVSKKYGEKIVLNNINIEIEEGEVVGVIGRNGAGKSTLFKILCGLTSQYDGECLVNGQVVKLSEINHISYMPEERGLDGRLLVREHLTDLAMYKGIKKKIAHTRIDYWLKVFELENKKYQKIDSLSIGNQQKIQFIETLLNEPDILILDEPFSGLDPISTDMFWNIIETLKKQNKTIIFSSHNLSDKIQKCDKFFFIKEGVIKESGSLKDIQNNFGYYLEIATSELSLNNIIELVNPMNVTQTNKYEYVIDINSKEEARKILKKLNQVFFEKFYVRRLSLLEIFRIVNEERNKDE